MHHNVSRLYTLKTDDRDVQILIRALEIAEEDPLLNKSQVTSLLDRVKKLSEKPNPKDD